jgi:ATP-dependent RNA helicase DeaD
MPPRIDAIARKHLRDPLRIQIGLGKRTPENTPRIRQTAYVVQRAHKPAALGRLLDDAALCRALGARARARVEGSFALEAVGARLREVLTKGVGNV